MLVTPKQAARWLLRNNHNRPLSFRKVMEIVSLIELHTLSCKDTIKVTSAGELLDGQHRLAAIVLTGREQNLDVECVAMILGIKTEVTQ